MIAPVSVSISSATSKNRATIRSGFPPQAGLNIKFWCKFDFFHVFQFKADKGISESGDIQATHSTCKYKLTHVFPCKGISIWIVDRHKIPIKLLEQVAILSFICGQLIDKVCCNCWRYPFSSVNTLNEKQHKPKICWQFYGKQR